MRGKAEPNKLKWKILILAGAALLLTGSIFLRQYERKKAREDYEKYVEQESGTEGQEGKPEEGGTEEQEAKTDYPDEGESGGQKETEEGKDAVVHITNLEEYAASLMGRNAVLLEQSLGGWAKEKHLATASAVILNVMIPEDDPQSISFYIRMEDEEGSLAMLSYRPEENVVTACASNYTEEEIRAEAWEGNGPGQRDVTAEADTKFLDSQEVVNDTEGEN